MVNRLHKWIISGSAMLLPQGASTEQSPTCQSIPRVGHSAQTDHAYQKSYLTVHGKFQLALTVSTSWLVLTYWLARPWTHDLAQIVGNFMAVAIVAGIAVVPGFLNAFLVVSLLVDRRPRRQRLKYYPSVSILIAAYNEAQAIAETIHSVAKQQYPGELEVLVIDDGSRDGTAAIVEALDYPGVKLIRQPRNEGKAAALNRGLTEAQYDLVITLDADCYLYKRALRNLVERYAGDPANTRAVAGAVLVRNSRSNWVTSVQEWDYFHGIAAIKRVQSLYHGTLVAQGAFSIYDRATLLEVGGWPQCVGEDIVLTWAILRRGFRVGHAEDACCFTNAPDRLTQFVRQRQRWSRGMMEAFRQHPGILLQPRMSTLFIWWNVLFPWLDLTFTLCFMPGVLAALFGIYWVAGPMTLALLPMAMLMNLLMFRIGSWMFFKQGLSVRRNVRGFLLYSLVYSFILQPACVAGYASELLGLRKTWGTK